jgi:hypothetical protein
MADTVKTGLAVKGLSETMRALGKINPKLKAEAKEVLRDGAKMVQKAAQRNIGAGGYRMGMGKGMIGRSVTAKGAGIRLRASKFPWAYAAEYGETVAHVYGRRTPQPVFRRRTAAPFKPPTTTDLAKNKGGYMIQPAIRKFMPVLIEDAGERITRLVDKAVKRG